MCYYFVDTRSFPAISPLCRSTARCAPRSPFPNRRRRNTCAVPPRLFVDLHSRTQPCALVNHRKTRFALCYYQCRRCRIALSFCPTQRLETETRCCETRRFATPRCSAPRRSHLARAWLPRYLEVTYARNSLTRHPHPLTHPLLSTNDSKRFGFLICFYFWHHHLPSPIPSAGVTFCVASVPFAGTCPPLSSVRSHRFAACADARSFARSPWCAHRQGRSTHRRGPHRGPRGRRFGFRNPRRRGFCRTARRHPRPRPPPETDHRDCRTALRLKPSPRPSRCLGGTT